MPDRRAPLPAVAGVLGVLAALGCLIAIGAAAGPGDVLTKDGPGRPPASEWTPSDTASPSGTPTSTAHQLHAPLDGWRMPPIVGDLLLGLLVALLLVGLGLLLRALWRYLQPGPPEEELLDVDIDPLADPVRVTRTLASASARGDALLDVGDPRNAVVACWEAFERGLTEAGVARQPWETSTELTVRALALVDADAAAVRRLAGLYREARFSEHPVGEAERAAAREALAAIRATLGEPSGHGRVGSG